MQFRDLKPGGSLYIYDRSAIEVNVAKVSAVSAPRMEKSGASASMVVDVTAEGVTYTFKDTSETGYTGNLIISPERLAVLKEVEAQKANNEALLARVESVKAEAPKLQSVLDTLNPEAKEKKQNEERLQRLEDSLGGLRDMLEQLVKKGGPKA